MKLCILTLLNTIQKHVVIESVFQNTLIYISLKLVSFLMMNGVCFSVDRLDSLFNSIEIKIFKVYFTTNILRCFKKELNVIVWISRCVLFSHIVAIISSYDSFTIDFALVCIEVANVC